MSSLPRTHIGIFLLVLISYCLLLCNRRGLCEYKSLLCLAHYHLEVTSLCVGFDLTLCAADCVILGKARYGLLWFWVCSSISRCPLSAGAIKALRNWIDVVGVVFWEGL